MDWVLSFIKVFSFILLIYHHYLNIRYLFYRQSVRLNGFSWTY
jgi:hypothetical protein